MTEGQRGMDKTSRFEAERRRLTAIANRLLGSRAEAEDVVQEAWLRWQTVDTALLVTPLAWLTAVTTRLAIDRLRRLQSERAAQATQWLAEPWLDDVAPSAEDQAARTAALAEALRIVCEQLSEAERVAFVLHEALDMDYAQISARLGKTAAHCRQLVHRARQRLADPDRPSRVDTAATRLLRRSRTHAIDRLREAIGMQDPEAVMAAFAAGAQCLRAPEPAHGVALDVAARGHAQAPAASVALQMPMPLCAKALHLDGEPSIALLCDGEIVALATMRFANGRLRLVRLPADGRRLRALNACYGLRAIGKMLAQLRSRCAIKA